MTDRAPTDRNEDNPADEDVEDVRPDDEPEDEWDGDSDEPWTGGLRGLGSAAV